MGVVFKQKSGATPGCTTSYLLHLRFRIPVLSQDTELFCIWYHFHYKKSDMKLIDGIEGSMNAYAMAMEEWTLIR